MRSEHEIMCTKTRLNYPNGGWCGRRKDCKGRKCEKCFKFSGFEEK